LKILFWSGTFWPRIGGVETLASRLLPDLRARGHDFVVVTWADNGCQDQLDYRGIPIYQFPFFSKGPSGELDLKIQHLHAVAKLKREFGPDVVHVNSYSRSAWYHILTANADPLPTLLTLHALPDANFISGTLGRRLLNFADCITCCSSTVLDETCRAFPGISSRARVVHNALEVPLVDPTPLSFEQPRLLFAGRLCFEKGLDWALSALTSVFERFPNAGLIVAGDGAERSKLEAYAADLRLTPFVQFVGAVSHESLPHLLNQSTVVIVPSRNEGFGLVALEAALMGRPVVGVRTGGLPEVVVHRETGLLVDSSEDSAGFARAIEFLLSHTPDG
jgi:glycogen(starch) synthase